MRRASGFWRAQTGAVTVDWIGLASAIILLGLVVVYSIYSNSAASLLVRIDDTLTDVRLGEPGTPKPFTGGATVASAGSPVSSSVADPGASSSLGGEATLDGTHDSSKDDGTNGEAVTGDVAKTDGPQIDGAKNGDADHHDGGKEYGAKSDGAKSDWGSGGKGDGGKGGGGKAGPGATD